MSNLANWLRAEMDTRALTQSQVATYTGVGPATISDMLNKDHIPRVETLNRLADFFAVSRERVLRAAGYLPDSPDEHAQAAEPPPDRYVEALLNEFRQVPDEWKPIVVQQVAQYRRLAELRPNVTGDDAETETEEEETQHSTNHTRPAD